MIIGLTGKNASGKGEIARFLQERGFTFMSLSDVLRDELTCLVATWDARLASLPAGARAGLLDALAQTGAATRPRRSLKAR